MSETLRAWTGREIDGLPLTEYLGGGESSAVFRSTFGDKSSALKIWAVAPDRAGAQLSRLNVAEKLSHPHLLPIWKTGRGAIDGATFVYAVSEFAEENLGQVLPERALSAEETRQALPSALDALAYLHGQGLVHADLKPANIMACAEQLKLSVDSVVHSGEKLERAPSPYDAPEAAESVSPASDVWSLGITLIQILTQQLPATPASPNLGISVPESTPAPFREIAQHCLLRTPELRWSIDDIARKLNFNAEPPAPTSAPVREVSPGPARPRPRSIRPFVLLAVVAMVVIAIVLLSRNKQKPNKDAVAANSSSPTTTEFPANASDAPARAKTTASQAKAAAPEKRAKTHETEQAPSAAGNTADGIVRRVMPNVIPQARNSIQGTVRVKLSLDVDSGGNVTNTGFVSAGPSRYFARVSEAAARQWKFTPADGGSRSWNVEFDFRRTGTEAHVTRP